MKTYHCKTRCYFDGQIWDPGMKIQSNNPKDPNLVHFQTEPVDPGEVVPVMGGDLEVQGEAEASTLSELQDVSEKQNLENIVGRTKDYVPKKK